MGPNLLSIQSHHGHSAGADHRLTAIHHTPVFLVLQGLKPMLTYSSVWVIIYGYAILPSTKFPLHCSHGLKITWRFCESIRMAEPGALIVHIMMAFTCGADPLQFEFWNRFMLPRLVWWVYFQHRPLHKCILCFAVVWQLASIGICSRGINGPGVALRNPFPPLQPQSRRGNEGINRTRSFRLFNLVCRFVLLGGGYHRRFSILQLLQLGSHFRPDSWESVSWIMNFYELFFSHSHSTGTMWTRGHLGISILHMPRAIHSSCAPITKIIWTPPVQEEILSGSNPRRPLPNMSLCMWIPIKLCFYVLNSLGI